jgi:multidrug efflux pump subunit AcrA (membrane-fusion protein)
MIQKTKPIWMRRPLFFSFLSFAVLSSTAYLFFTITTRHHQFAAPRIGPAVESVYGIGTVKSRKEYTYRLGFTKFLTKLYVEEGQQVNKNQIMAIFDETSRVSAPFSGTVTKLGYHENELIMAQSAVLTLEDLNNLYLEVALDQQAAMRVKKEMKAVLVFESIRNMRFEGRVERIYPKDKQFIVHIHPENLPREIMNGMTADVAIEVARNANALLIPSKAISGGLVVVKRDNKRLKVPVDIGIMDDQWAEVTGDSIDKNDLILVKGK